MDEDNVYLKMKVMEDENIESNTPSSFQLHWIINMLWVHFLIAKVVNILCKTIETMSTVCVLDNKIFIIYCINNTYWVYL
jgi:hypothetical protein